MGVMCAAWLAGWLAGKGNRMVLVAIGVREDGG